MSHIKDRLSDYHDFMKKLADDHQIVLASDVLEMIEQLKDDLELDEKENGWIPVSERLPEDGTYITTLDGELVGQEEPFTGMCGIENGKWDDEDCVIAWMPLPKPYKEDLMGYCKLECSDGEAKCCIYCTKQDSCQRRCDDMDSYEYAEECKEYVKEEET